VFSQVVVVRRAYVATVAEDRITAHGRELGVELRRRRELAGYNGLELANRLGWSTTKVSRVETGARIISEVDIAIYLASCGVPRLEMDGILDLAREASYDHRLKSHGEKLPDELRTLIFHETTAAEIDSYELVVVPGLLQTEDYTRALLQANGLYAGDSFEFRVGARMARQGLLRRSYPPHCTFFIHEHALRTPIGSNRIMHEQLLQLVFLSSWRHCSIRVVPVSAGGQGVVQASFRLMGYAEHDPVAYIEQEAVSLFLDRRAHTDHYRKVLDRLDRVALDGGESRGILADLANDFDRAEDGHDG
jgi:transcriptional regulator with XRE-family HTH domain